MYASMFFSVSEEIGQLSCTCKRLLNRREKTHISGWELGWLLRILAQFMAREAECYLDLYKLWAEYPSWEGLHNFLGEDCPSELHNSRAQWAAS